MAKSGEDTYICKLDENTLKRAKEELNEDEIQRASQIETLRQWVKSQPHLRSRTGKFNTFVLGMTQPVNTIITMI